MNIHGSGLGTATGTRLDRAVIASVLAMAAMNLIVLSDLMTPARTVVAAPTQIAVLA